MKSGWGCALTALIVIVCGIAAVSLFEQAYRRMNEVAMERSRIRSEVGQIILAYYRDYDEPPSGLPDLEEYADEFPDGYRELSQGKWTVRWGLTLNKSHRFQGNWDRILAYKESEDASRSWTISAGGGGSIDDNEGLHKTIEASTIMHDIFDMYSAYIKEHGKPPLSKDDLKPYAEKHPKGYDAIGQDPWVVRWGTELSDDDIENSDIVLVYGKKVINDLGFALCADGVAYPVINDELPRWLEAGPIAHQIARMYFAYYKAHTKPPTRIEDLEPYEKTYPIGYQAAKSAPGSLSGAQKSVATGKPIGDGFWPMTDEFRLLIITTLTGRLLRTIAHAKYPPMSSPPRIGKSTNIAGFSGIENQL